MSCWVIAVLSIILIFLTYRKLCNKLILGRIPSPAALPIIGLALELPQENRVTLFQRLREYAKEYKGIYRIPLMFFDIIEIYNAEDIEQIMKSNAHQTKGHEYEFLQKWLGTGLLTSEGEKWRRRRKLLTPAFHFEILKEFLICFNEETRRFVKNIEENIEQCNEDIKPCVVSFTMKTICETAMGLDEVDEAKVVDYRIKMKNYTEILIKRNQRIWFRIPFLFNLSNMAKEEEILVKSMQKFSNDVIKNRMKKRKESIIKRRRMAMLDLLLKSHEEGANIDLEGIQEEVDTFIFEGHDTTSAAIFFLLLLLANHTDVQEKAREEVENIFQGEDRDCTYEDLSNLEYVDCCIKEALRLYPSVPMISRQTSEPYTTTTGYDIPKGTIVNLQIYDLHRDPKIFPDPEKFDPERFRLENSRNRPPFAYVPFSGGARNCIGQKFAMLELKTLLCGILRNFKLEAIDTPQDMVFEVDLILSTVNPIRVKFIKK